MTEKDGTVETYIQHLNGRVWGLAFGLLSGMALFVATVVLVLKGGDDVGTHLGLLGNFFPFYDVTWFGAFLGFIYAFFVGYITGRAVCIFYNVAARPRG